MSKVRTKTDRTIGMTIYEKWRESREFNDRPDKPLKTEDNLFVKWNVCCRFICCPMQQMLEPTTRAKMLIVDWYPTLIPPSFLFPFSVSVFSSLVLLLPSARCVRSSHGLMSEVCYQPLQLDPSITTCSWKFVFCVFEWLVFFNNVQYPSTCTRGTRLLYGMSISSDVRLESFWGGEFSDAFFPNPSKNKFWDSH